MRLMMELNSSPNGTVVERVDGRKLTKQLEDLQYRWRSEYMRLQDNYEARNLPRNTIPVQQPNEKLVEIYDKKFDR